jgi:hypothetical protein
MAVVQALLKSLLTFFQILNKQIVRGTSKGKMEDLET